MFVSRCPYQFGMGPIVGWPMIGSRRGLVLVKAALAVSRAGFVIRGSSGRGLHFDIVFARGCRQQTS